LLYKDRFFAFIYRGAAAPFSSP